MQVNLLRLLQDWLDKEKFPIISITGITQTYIPSESIGNIWIGDYDVGIVKTDMVGIVHWRQGVAIHNWILAADPDFFQKLENEFIQLTTLLKKYRDE